MHGISGLVKRKGDKDVFLPFLFRYSLLLDARCILLDMEEKVVSRCITEASGLSGWNYNPKLAKVRESGAGNNWAFGFFQLYSIVLSSVLSDISV